MGGIYSTMRDAKTKRLTSSVRSKILIIRAVLGFLIAGLQITLFFLGLGTVGWDGV